MHLPRRILHPLGVLTPTSPLLVIRATKPLSCGVGGMLSADEVGVLVRATYGCYASPQGFIVVETENVRRSWGAVFFVEELDTP